MNSSNIQIANKNLIKSLFTSKVIIELIIIHFQLDINILVSIFFKLPGKSNRLSGKNILSIY